MKLIRLPASPALAGTIRWLSLALAALVISGCGVVNHMVYKTTGDVMQGFSRNHTVPYLMQQDDVAMGCAMSRATAPLLMSFGRVTTEPDQLAVMLYLSSGACAEARAREAELAGIAALNDTRPAEAQDAQIRQQRDYALAARRYYTAWNHLEAYYGDVDAGTCPDFDDELDEFIYLSGLLSGLQALNAQIQSASSEGVPTNIAAVAARATGCLSNEKWWGAPMALRATVWALMPGSMPRGEDAFERLAIADTQGEAAGVRLAHVFHAIAAMNQGDTEAVKDVIRAHAASLEQTPANPDWRFVDAMATDLIVAISDQLWMANTGHRTPRGQLGSFWDDPKETVETMSLDGLL